MKRQTLRDPDRKVNLDRGRSWEEIRADTEEKRAGSDVSSHVDVREARNFVRSPETYWGAPNMTGGSVPAADAALRRLHSGRVFELRMPTREEQ